MAPEPASHTAGRTVRIEVAGIDVDVSANSMVAAEVDQRFGHYGPRRWSLQLPRDQQVAVTPLGQHRLAVARGADRGSIDLLAAHIEVHGDACPSFVDALMRLVVSYRLALMGGLLVHGAAIERATGAAVFVGPSGSGKSTLAAHFGTPLADELVALVPSADGLEARGTPWWHGRSARLPLRHLIVLARGRGRFVEPCERGQLCRELSRHSVCLLPADPEHSRAHFAAVVAVAAHAAVRVAAGEGTVIADVEAALANLEAA